MIYHALQRIDASRLGGRCTDRKVASDSLSGCVAHGIESNGLLEKGLPIARLATMAATTIAYCRKACINNNNNNNCRNGRTSLFNVAGYLIRGEAQMAYN